MNWQNIWRLAKSDYLTLVPILVLASYMAFIPNLSYPYPVHIDEWAHIAAANALLQAADIDYPEPFSGQGLRGLTSLLEIGFHIPFAVFYRISGISWIDIVRYSPSIIFAVTVLSVYILARREGFGWEAAFFTCLIPTTIGIMGPAFFVPVALGLLFVALSLFLVFNFRTFWSYVSLFIFTVFLVIMHATSAVILIVILVPSIVLYLKSDPKHSLTLIMMLTIPFLVTLPWTFNLIMDVAKSLLVQTSVPPYIDLPLLLRTYGYVPAGLGLLGVFSLAVKGGAKNYGLFIGLLALSSMLAIFFALHYGNHLIYLRGMLYMLLMLSIVAGAGLMLIKNPEQLAKTGLPRIMRRIGYPLCGALVVAILLISIPTRHNIPYYHMIEKEDYEAFIWIRDNVDEIHQKAILDPWKATAFNALTGKYVYARKHSTPTPKGSEARDFLESGCKDTAFLIENGISIVYNQLPCSNSNLVEVRKDVYLLKEAGNP
ncbi:hypothetical protein ACFLV4_02120 [Chloroflexota bacterium]